MSMANCMANTIDFVLAEKDGESFYPFLSNEYSGIACYKMEKAENGIVSRKV